MKLVLLCAFALAGCGNSPAADSCTQAVCPSGGRTYRFCSAGGKCGYVSSDGQHFDCLSCGSCSVAASALAAWCGTGSSTTTGGTTGSATGSTSGGTTGGGPPDLSHTTV